jgi:hypothetical protein
VKEGVENQELWLFPTIAISIPGFPTVQPLLLRCLSKLIEDLLLVTLPSPHFDILGIITKSEGSASRSISQLTVGLEAANRRSFRHPLRQPSSVWSSDLPTPDKRRTVRTLSLVTGACRACVWQGL